MEQLIQSIQKLPKQSIVMISGFGGAGKSTLATTLASQFNAQVIPFDDFYRIVDTYERWDCYDYQRLIQEVLIPFKHNEYNTYSVHNWINPDIPQMKTLLKSDYLILEGVGLFHPDILAIVDYSIWIDCPIDIAFHNGKYRDKYEYGSDNEAMWDGIWKENDLDSFNFYKPLDKADYQYKWSFKKQGSRQ